MFSSRVISRSISRSTSRQFSTTLPQNADFTHAVIGGGVVGLAIARQLQSRDGSSTVLIEKHGSAGTETSSRNSEVIHAGLYYEPDSLKTTLCIKGKKQLYDLCEKHSIPHRNTGKWIVAQDSEQLSAIEKVHAHSKIIGVPTHFLSKKEAKDREPDVRAEAGILESPTTGIIDSHSLMQFLQGDFENHGGICAFNSPVTSIRAPSATDSDWHISTTDPSTAETTSITSETLINAAGLHAIPISNLITPHTQQRKAYYAKGTYYSYTPSHPRPRTLIYPAPIPGHGGLGTHLTLDISGRIRFGPDVEWIDNPADYTPNSRNIELAIKDIQSYLPGVKSEDIQVDYAGIRPKLGRPPKTAGQGFFDFYIRREEVGKGTWVNLLGIESPGLTSCLAIGECVEGLLYR